MSQLQEMETEEIYSLAISPLVMYRFAVEWSEDNHISVFTEKGLSIFELIPSPMSPQSTIKFSRSFLYPPHTFPTEEILKKVEPKIWSMNRTSLYSFMMDESLTPKFSNLKDMIPKIIHLAWSPQDLIYPSKCLLAILTSAGVVMIVYKISTNWYPAHDLASIRSDAVQPEISKKLNDIKGNNDSHNFQTLKDLMQTFKPSCFTWSKLFNDFAYLIVAYLNGDIVFYKIPRISNYNEMGNPEIVDTIKLKECVKINALSWITLKQTEHLLIVGYFDGRIYGLKVSDQDQKPKLVSTEKYYDYQDRITINTIQKFPSTDHNVKVLAAKGNFIFLLSFTEDGTLKNLQHLQLEGFMISGMTCISSDYAMVTTENNIMLSVNTKNNELVIERMYNKFGQAQMRYLGLAQSPSSTIFITVVSPNTIYDHLVMKEPSKICMFGLKDKRWDSFTILMQSQSKKFGDLWDCLEVLRMRATKVVSDPATVLPPIPSDLKSLSILELRIAMWTSVILEICRKRKVVQGVVRIAGEISEAQPLIFVHNACNYLLHLASKPSLSEEQKLCVHLLITYLEQYLTKDEADEESAFNKRIVNVLNKVSTLDSNKTETCNLCGVKINDVPWKVTQCEKGHLLPRCAITLLQITDTQYKTCPICGLTFHSSLDEEFKETRCLFCDVPALQDHRVLNPTCHIPKMKTLSKPEGLASAAADSRETEAIT